MKKVVFLATIFVLFAGCSTEKKVENKPVKPINRAEAPQPVDSANFSNTSSNAIASGQKPIGEKIEKINEIFFESNGFPPGWQWLDPDEDFNPTKYDLKAGVLHIEVPSGKDLFGETRTAPQLLKSVSGDFEIETKVKFDPKDSYQGAGLLIFRNDSNYLRLERGFGGVGGDNGIRFDVREDESFEPLATQEKFPTSASVVELKIRRVGKEFTGFWREPSGEWKEVAKYSSSYPETLQIGLIACNTAEEIPVEFSYIKLSPGK